MVSASGSVRITPRSAPWEAVGGPAVRVPVTINEYYQPVHNECLASVNLREENDRAVALLTMPLRAS